MPACAGGLVPVGTAGYAPGMTRDSIRWRSLLNAQAIELWQQAIALTEPHGQMRSGKRQAFGGLDRVTRQMLQSCGAWNAWLADAAGSWLRRACMMEEGQEESVVAIVGPNAGRRRGLCPLVHDVLESTTFAHQPHLAVSMW